MRARRILVTVVGVAQEAIGLLVGVLACILYFNFLDVQTMLNVSPDLLPLYLLILGVFSSFSMINGFLLVHEGLE